MRMSQKFRSSSALLLMLAVAAAHKVVDIATSAHAQVAVAAQPQARNWYVDKVAPGSTHDGTSWHNAWTNLADIQWGEGGIMPGDTLYLSGGDSSQTYDGRLWIEFPYSDPRVTGTAEKPITIKVGQEPGYNGTAIITNNSGYGIYVQSEDYVTIDGSVNGEIHMKISDCSDEGILAAGSHHLTLTYLEVSHNGDAGGEDGIELNNLNFATQCAEVSYCKIHDNYQDQITYGGARMDSGYGRFLIHHNEIYNLNDDGIEGGEGIDFYENKVHDMATTGTDTGHPDGIQTGGGGYIRIWNNTFYNLYNPAKGANAAMEIGVWNAENEAISHLQIYNNLAYSSQSDDTSVFRGLEFACCSNPDAISSNVSDVLIANNTFVNLPFFELGVFLADGNAQHGPEVHDIRIVNNVMHHCRWTGGTAVGIALLPGVTTGSWGETADVIIDNNLVSPGGADGVVRVLHRGITYDDNAAWSTATGVQKHIVGNPDALLNPDFTLTFNSPAKDAGVNLSAYFSTDKSGTLRPQGDAWDIGAYELVPGLDLHGAPADHAIHLTWAVNATLPPTSTWRLVHTNQLTPTPVTIGPVISTTRAYDLDNLTNDVLYTVTLNAMLDATPFLTDTVSVKPGDPSAVLFLPLVSREGLSGPGKIALAIAGLATGLAALALRRR